MIKFPRPLPDEIREKILRDNEPAVYAMTAGSEEEAMPGIIITGHKPEAVRFSIGKDIEVSTALVAKFTPYGTAIALQATFTETHRHPPLTFTAQALLESDHLAQDPIIRTIQRSDKIAVIFADLEGICYSMRVGTWDQSARESSSQVIAQAELHDQQCRQSDRYDLKTAQAIFIDANEPGNYN